jgi:hypothetical protein
LGAPVIAGTFFFLELLLSAVMARRLRCTSVHLPMDCLAAERRGRQAVLSRHLLDLIGDLLPKPDRDCGRVPFFPHSDPPE